MCCTFYREAASQLLLVMEAENLNYNQPQEAQQLTYIHPCPFVLIVNFYRPYLVFWTLHYVHNPNINLKINLYIYNPIPKTHNP